MKMCVNLNDYKDGAVLISIPNSYGFLVVELDENRSLQKKGEYTTRIARSNFGCCCPQINLKTNP
jgi:hypothetical protein